MNMNTFLFACLLFASQIAAFQWNNYQTPGYTTRNEHRYRTVTLNPITNPTVYQSTAGTFVPPVYRSAGNTNSVTYGQVNPTFKNVNTYVESFKPFGANVLISYSADDDATATLSNGLSTLAPSQNSLLTGIVVATGSGVASAKLTEGARVYFSPACATKWTGASWSGTYGTEKITMMNQRYVNGVDLNNAEGWNSDTAITNPGLYYGGTTAAASTVSYLTTSLNGYSMTSQGDTTYATAADAELPTLNANQQANYLLCPESSVWGVISESHFPNLEAGHYEQTHAVLRGLRNPTPFKKSSV